jgi:hypothetical protein
VKLLPPVAALSAVTATAPVAAPGMTMPTSVVPLFDTTMAALPPILNSVGLLRLVPVIVTRVPTGPLAGLNEVIVVPGVAYAPIPIRHMTTKRIICFFKKVDLSF